MNVMNLNRLTGQNVADVASFIEDTERELNLLTREFFGARIWPSLRNQLLNEILTAIGAYGGTAFHSNIDRSKPTLSVLLRGNPLLRWDRRPFVVIGSPTYSTKDKIVDIYSDGLIAKLPPNDTELIRLAGANRREGNQSGPKVFDALPIHLLYRISRRYYSYRIRRNKSGEIETLIGEIAALVARRFGCTLPLDRFVKYTAAHYLAQKDAWGRYFRRRHCQYVMLGFESYGNEGIIRAAHDCGARVVEMQHGLISRGHLGYHFCGRPIVSDRPDLMLLFGPAWRDAAEFPANTALAYYGFAPISETRRRFAAAELVKEPKIAILSSDPFCNDVLVQVAELVARQFPDKKVVVRPHPRDKYDYHAPLKSIGNIQFSTRSEPVHELIACCETLITGPSTSAFEALALDCRVLSWPFQFEPVFAPLCSGTPIRIIRTLGDVSAAMKLPNAPFDGSKFFTRHDVDLIDLITHSDPKAVTL